MPPLHQEPRPAPTWPGRLLRILIRVKDRAVDDNLTIIAAGVAFYAFLSLIPALSATISTWGLFADTQTFAEQLKLMSAVLPDDAFSIVSEQMGRISNSSSEALGSGLFVSILLSVWSAKKGTQAIVTATNIAYDASERRGFVEMTLLTLAMTFGAVVMTVVMCAAIVALPAVLSSMGLERATQQVVGFVRWPLVAIVVAVALAAIYRWSPNRNTPTWRWVFPGAAFATIGWLAASAAFSFFIANFGNFNETYGALGAVVVLMMWFYLSAFVVLVGAELNAETEDGTSSDRVQSTERCTDPVA